MALPRTGDDTKYRFAHHSVGVALVSVAALLASAACSSHGSSPANCVGASTPPRQVSAPFSCNLGTSTSLVPYDPATNCLGDPVTVSGLCFSTETPCPDTGIGVRCVVGPDGAAYLKLMTGDEDITGPGWSEIPGPSYTSAVPTGGDPSATAQAACAAAHCGRYCGSGQPPYLPGIPRCDGGMPSDAQTNDGEPSG